MTDTTEQEALAEVNAAHPYTHWNDIRDVGQGALVKTLCRAIERDKAFRQEVSDAVERAVDDCGHDGLRKAYIHSRFFHFIIAKPLDPLVEAMQEWWDADGYANIETFRAAIAKRGGKIVWGEG